MTSDGSFIEKIRGKLYAVSLSRSSGRRKLCNGHETGKLKMANRITPLMDLRQELIIDLSAKAFFWHWFPCRLYDGVLISI